MRVLGEPISWSMAIQSAAIANPPASRPSVNDAYVWSDGDERGGRGIGGAVGMGSLAGAGAGRVGSRYRTAIAISAIAGRTEDATVPLMLPPRGSQKPRASAMPMNSEASSM